MKTIRCKNITGSRLFQFVPPLLAGLTLWAGVGRIQAQILQLHVPFTNSVGSVTYSTPDGTAGVIGFNMYVNPNTPTGQNLINNNAAAVRAYYPGSLDFSADIVTTQGTTQPGNGSGLAPALVLNGSAGLATLGNNGLVTNCFYSWWAKSTTFTGGLQSGQNPRMFVLANGNNNDFASGGTVGAEIQTAYANTMAFNGTSATGSTPGNVPFPLCSPTAAAQPGQWMFWGFSYDGTNLYVWYGTDTNAPVIIGSGTLNHQSVNLGSTSSLNFGNESAKAWDRGFNGWLSDLRFYSFNPAVTGVGSFSAANAAFVSNVWAAGLTPITIASAAAVPAAVSSGNTVLLTVGASSLVGGIPATANVSNVVVNASSISSAPGAASLALAYDSNVSDPTFGLWTNTVTVTAVSYPVLQSLPVTVQDGASNTIGGAMTLEILGPVIVWNGGDFANNNNTFGDAANWVGGVAPGAAYVLDFAGTTQTSVDMQANYSVSGLAFTSGAGSFTITNPPGTVLTVDAGSSIVNNSTSTETLNVPVQIGGAVSITAASGNIALGQAVGGTGPLTLAGPDAVTLGGTNTYTGSTVVSSGTLTIGPGGLLNNGVYGGTIANSGTLNLFGGEPQTNNGIISGAGTINVSGGGPNNGPILTLTAGNTFTGNLTLSNTYVSDTFQNNNLNITGSGIGNPQTVGQVITINSNAVLSLDNSNPLGNGSTIEKGTIVINAGGVFQITAVNGNATVPAIVLNGGTMQAVGSTGGSSQYAALELGSGLTAGGVNASPSLITVVNGGPFAEINLLVNASSGSSLWTVNPAGINPTGAPDLTVSIPLINSSSTQYTNTGLSKSGAGTLLLNATGNNYTGPTTINAGTLILGDPGLLAVGTYAAPIINNSLFVCSTTAGQIFSGVISGTGTNAVYGPGANLTLTGASTYTGPTIIGAGGSLLLSGTASIATSSSITVSNGGTFNVSGESSQYKLGSAQSLLGTGNINGTIGSSSGSKIFPGTDGTAGTLTFGNGLNVAVGASLNLDVGTTYNGANDLIIVGGALTIGSGDFVHIKAPSTSSSLDESGHDYILVTAGSISGSFSQAPAFDVLPTDAGHYSIVTDPINNQVRLHYSSTLSPVITTVTATPSSGIVRGSTVFVSATVAPGAGSVTNVSVSLGAVGGGTLALLPSGTPNVYTNSIVIVPTIAPGPYNLTVFATDTTPLSGAGNLAFTVAASSETWDGLGANQSVDTNANWTSGFAPGYVGDSLVFAGTVGLNPVLDQDYTVTALTFSNTAGLFIVTNSTGDFLTLAPGAGLTNNSANTEIVSVPIELAGSVILKSATATGALALTQPVGELVVGSGSVTNAGGTNILYGANTYTGNTTITAGTLIIGSNAVSAGSLNGGGYTGAISNSGTFDYFGGQAANFSGPISGAGGFNLGNGGTNNGPIVFMSNNFSFTGNMVITNTYVSLVQANNNNPITTSVLGNPATAGRTVTISNAFLSFDATGGNELGGGAFAPALGFIVGQGGVMQITSGNCVIGPLTLNGGIVNIASTAGTQYEPFELGGAVTVGGTTASLITNVTDGPGAGLNLTIAATSGNTTFTVAATGATGPDLTVAVPLANSGSEAAGASTIGLIKAGAGTMALTDPNNSYTGGTTINAGTLILANSGELNGGTYTGTISNSGTFIVSTAAGQTLSGPVYGAGLLEVSGAGVSLTLGAANAYTGKTLITNSATLFLGSSGSIANSSNITVAPNSLFDVSQAVSPALGVNQSLFGLGTIHTANSVGLGSSTGSVIAPSNDGTNAIGRMSFTGGGLSFGAGATAKFALSATYNGVNDSIAVAGALTGAANSIHLRAPSAAANLDTSGNDYILMTAGSVVGGFASTPIWDVAPLNAANYTIISDPVNANVRLHYSVNLPPTAGGSFNPSTNALRNGNALLTVLVTNGSSGTISSVVVNAAPLGGSSSLALAFQSPGVYTTTITIPPTAAPGAQSVLVQITDGNGLVDAISVGLTIVTSREIWDGLGAGNQNWDVNANWASGAAPGYLGDSLIFAGNVETSPIMDQNYTTGSLTFSNTTSSFNITSTGSTLTLPNAAGITNLSGVAQTLNVPIALNGALILNSTNTNGSLVLPGNLSEVTLGAGSITNTGSGTNILEGNNSFTGNITIAGGTFELGTNGNLAGGTYNGTISLSTGAKFNYFAGTPQTFSGTSVITGPTGAPLNFIGGGTNTGSPIVILAGRNTFSGNTYISNIWVSNQRSDSASQDPPFSGIGNVDQAGQTFTIDHSALLSFDIGNELGENNSPDNVTFVITNGGTFAQTVGNSPIGSLALYGGTVDIQSGGGPGSSAAGVELSGTVVAGNATTGPSYIGSSTGAGGMNLGVITSAGYQASFTVNPAGVNPSGLPDLTVSAFLGNCGNNNAASGLIKLGTGSLLLSGENVYTSTTTLSNGIITLGSAETAPTSGPLGASPSTTPGRISFGGGTLQYSSANQFDYSGGFSTAAGQTIIIDTAGQTIQFATPLISSGGTLTVTDSVGSGVLSLTAAETYSGATTVNGGTLSLGTGGSLASASSLNIGAGGTFDVSQVSPYSLGTSASLTASGTGAKPATLNGSANLGSRPITLNYNGLNPALTVTGGTLTLNGNAFTVNGTPLAPATYTLIQQASGSVSSSGTYTVSGTAIASPNTGSITVTGGQVKLTVSPPAFPTTGTNLTFSVSGRSLTFTWPASYLGSVLQSNSVNIASNSLWFAISGSASVTNLTLPVATNGTVFYRLNTP